eukprot:TRINITY_DN13304_c0_g2_i2.p1 TRINITY_DN13304_c0_g2~~TRINITY_DN13304_c0_g2_i2.p1  ORF type:complete len:176 (+),score=19.24 TRINITY_DN13304_c0_g2_i2:310-837(+)
MTSGAFLNPAITLSFLMVSRLSWLKVILYLVGQFVGSLLSSLTHYWIFPEDLLRTYHYGATLLSTEMNITPAKGILLEVLMTFLLTLVCLLTGGRKDRSKESKAFASLATGTCLSSIILFCGPLTGASLNPARSFGPAVLGNVWNDHYVFWVGPLIGSSVAAVFFRFFYPESSTN